MERWVVRERMKEVKEKRMMAKDGIWEVEYGLQFLVLSDSATRSIAGKGGRKGGAI